MFSSNKIEHRKFTNSFLLTVVAVIFLSFIALRAYQIINKRQPTKEIGEQQALVNSLQSANQPAWQNVSVDLQGVSPIQVADHLLGQVDAPVQLIVYSDLADPLAASFLPIVEELKKQVGDKLVIAWRQHPLANNSLASEAAIAVECAGQQGQFWAFADKVAAAASQEQPLADWTVVAQETGLKLVDFDKCLTKPEVQATIDKQSAEAEALGAIGVPSSFLNRTLLSGVYPLADFTSSDGQTKAGLLKLVQQAMVQKPE